MRQPADAVRRREGGVRRGREGRTTIGHSVIFYGGDAAAVPQGELGDPSRKIEAVHLKQQSSWHPVKLLHEKKYLCVHMRTCMHLADGPTPKKNTQKIGQKNRMPSEKEKKGTPKVFQRICFSPLRSKKSQPYPTFLLTFGKRFVSFVPRSLYHTFVDSTRI